MSKSRFDSYNSFLKKYHRYIIVGWFVALVIAGIFLPSFFSKVSFNFGGGGFNQPNSESQQAQNIVNAQFPSSNSSVNSIIVVYETSSPYSSSVNNDLHSLNQTLRTDSKIANYTGMQTLYSLEFDLTNATVQAFIPEVSTFSANVSNINSELYSLQSGINSTAQLIYGVPANFVQTWLAVLPSCRSNVYCANNETNSLILPKLSGEASGYYEVFYNIWNSTFAIFPNSTTPSPLEREQLAVNNSVPVFVSNPAINSAVKQIFTTTAEGLNVSTWNQKVAISNLTISYVTSEIPSNSTFSSGNNSFLQNSNLSIHEILIDAYNLGPFPSSAAAWDLSSGLLANATSSLFQSSPLFRVNSTALSELLSNFNNSTTTPEASNQIQTFLANKSYFDSPFVPAKPLTSNFVNSQNNTMLVLLTFSSFPNTKTISAVHNDVHTSSLSTQGKLYVTGSAVISQDLANAIEPAIKTTLIPGVIVSLFVAGFLFLSPLAVLLPLLIAGVSIAISLPLIEFATVVVEKGQISFVTPALGILVMLGLAVDYSILQIRRTREERLAGCSKDESVSLSVRWAGQAVITAAITVIIAYIVLAAARVPFFGDVGSSIAIGVTVLLGVSLTLLPSLELALGDRIFWPGLQKRIGKSASSNSSLETRLRKVTQGTIKRKVAIVCVITLFAAGSFYVFYYTPSGINIIQLLPNFESNQGLTVLNNNFGGAAFAPTQIVITTLTPIVYGNNQFNMTLLNEMEDISSIAGNTTGVSSVSGPTRPFGSTFNYSSVNDSSNPQSAQYISAILADIGKNNKTALITVGLSSSPESAPAITTLQNMEKRINASPLLSGTHVYYGGDTQSTSDVDNFLNGILPEVVLILSIAVYIILFFQLRSAFTSFRLIFTLLCACVFSLAFLSVLYFHLFGLPILNFSSLFVLVTMLGVGTDYDIFLVTRIREEVLKGKSDIEAIKSAVGKVWITIFGLGLILSCVFASVALSGISFLAEIGFPVATAVMVDVVINILFFVPALMALASKYNWWPSKVARDTPVSKK